MRKLFLLILFPLFSIAAFGQKVTISGYIYELGSLDTLPGTLIYDAICS